MSKTETVRIVHEGFPEGVLINKTDFNPREHAIFGEEVKALADMSPKELRTFAGEHGIAIPTDATTKEALLSVIQAADFKLNAPKSEGDKA